MTDQTTQDATASDVGSLGTAMVKQRGLRRAIAINAVQMAREHAERGTDHFTQSDADVVMYITELLDRVAGTP